MQSKRDNKRKRFAHGKHKQRIPKVKSFAGAESGLAVLFPRSAPEYNELTNGPDAFLQCWHKKLLADFGLNGSFIITKAYRVLQAPARPAGIFTNTGAAGERWDIYKSDRIEFAKEIK